MVSRITILLYALFLVGCSTSDDFDDYMDNSQANPIAYDSFIVSRPMPRRPANDFEFYYKHCTQTDRPYGWSATSYDCTTSAF